MSTAQIYSIGYGNITVDGEHADFSGLYWLSGSDFRVINNATVNLDNLYGFSFSYLSAENGGSLVLPTRVTSLGYVTLYAEGFGSLLDLSSVTDLYGLHVGASSDGIVNLNGLSGTLQDFTLDVSGYGVVDLASITEIENAYIATGYGAFIDLEAVTSVRNSTIYGSGGEIRLSQFSPVIITDTQIYLDGGSISAETLTIDAGSRLEGYGSIWGGLVNNSGVLLRAFGTLYVNGLYRQSAGATLSTELYGYESNGTFYRENGRLSASDAVLGGTLHLENVYGFEPQLDDSFTILDATFLSGTFASIDAPLLLGDLEFAVSYLADSVRVDVVEGLPLMAAAAASDIDRNPPSVLDAADVQPLAAEAADRWKRFQLAEPLIERMRQLEVRIADLPDGYLGLTTADVLWIDLNADGYGWFVDATPGDDEEFSRAEGVAGLIANAGAAAGKVDLLTVLMHEMGHAIGLEDLTTEDGSEDLMFAWLAPGQRRLPSHDALDAVFGRWQGIESIAG